MACDLGLATSTESQLPQLSKDMQNKDILLLPGGEVQIHKEHPAQGWPTICPIPGAGSSVLFKNVENAACQRGG